MGHGQIYRGGVFKIIAPLSLVILVLALTRDALLQTSWNDISI